MERFLDQVKSFFGKARGVTTDRASQGNRAGDKTADLGESAVAGIEPTKAPGVSGLPESAQATIDHSRQRANAVVRNAAVELDSAPVDMPANPDEAGTDRDVASRRNADDMDHTVHNAKADRFQE